MSTKLFPSRKSNWRVFDAEQEQYLDTIVELDVEERIARFEDMPPRYVNTVRIVVADKLIIVNEKP